MKKILLIMAVGFCLYGCVNYQAAWKIRKKYDKAYNGVDTLININGYYYRECLPNVCNPTVFTENGDFTGWDFSITGMEIFTNLLNVISQRIISMGTLLLRMTPL